MAEYFSPGVYVEEFESSPRAIEGVGTSTGGFVGMAVKGPTIGAPSLVTSFADFQRQFGGFLSEFTHGEYRYLAYSVEQFFINGGTRCYISRVVPEDAAIATAKSCPCVRPTKESGATASRFPFCPPTAERCSS